MSVSGRRLERVVCEYLRARYPVRISPEELLAAMQEFGYLSGKPWTRRKMLYRALKRLPPHLSNIRPYAHKNP